MNITIHSRKSIEYLLQSGFPENTALIRFYDIELMRENSKFKAVSFHDNVQRIFQLPLMDIDLDELKYYDFTYETFFTEADELAEFIYSAITDDLNIICQCEYGQSRSAGCAAAILEYFEGNGISIFSDYRYFPNKIVYHKLLEALKKYGKVESIDGRRFLIRDGVLKKYLGNDKKVVIPESVTQIDFDAFRNCKGLEELVITQNVKELYGKSFEDCINLKSISVDERNTHYDSRNNCNAVIKSRANELVLGCINTVIPDTVVRINEFAFSECPSKVILPESVTSIDFMAFSYCSNLEELFIPHSTTEILDMAFFYCANIKKIAVDSRNEVYDSRNDCNAIIETAINKLIVGCYNTVIPDDVCIIAGEAFAYLDKLTDIRIPESVIIIEESAFEECENLTIYCYSGSYAEKYAKENDIKYKLIDNDCN